MSFVILKFDDYHEISNAVRPGEKWLELGAFAPANSGGLMYYGLFYKGHKPAVKKVADALFPMVNLQATDGDMPPNNYAEMLEDIKQAMTSPGQPYQD